MTSNMNQDFYSGFRQTMLNTEWLVYLGCPMLYDGGLCVNRERQEMEYSSKRKYHSYLEI